MKKQNKHLTPDWISELSDCEVFVFGSNLEGQHLGGAARLAHDKFGAEWGVGVGPTGRCYAIPTMHGGVEDIKPYVDEFIEYAANHPLQRFLLTRIGCGIAGFRDDEIAPLFWKVLDLPNVTIPEKWKIKIITEHQLIDPTIKAAELVNSANESTLEVLCEKYNYIIGAGLVESELPSLRVRYVKGENEFGYVRFGDFYFYNDDFYVWSLDDRWAEYHDQNAVEAIFHDQCYNRGYFFKAVFAGVWTNFVDITNEHVYTGDIVEILDSEDNHADYAMLDCNGLFYSTNYVFFGTKQKYDYATLNNYEYKILRVGTMFFNLSEDRSSKTLAELKDLFMQESSDMEALLQRAVITPAFGDTWQQRALPIIGAEYHWHK